MFCSFFLSLACLGHVWPGHPRSLQLPILPAAVVRDGRLHGASQSRGGKASGMIRPDAQDTTVKKGVRGVVIPCVQDASLPLSVCVDVSAGYDITGRRPISSAGV